MKGDNERLLYEILNDVYPNEWVCDKQKVVENRRFRFDCANPSKKIAIEIEGGIWMGGKGGHTSGMGYERNMEKYNLAVVEGWKVLRYSPETLRKRHWQIIKDVRQLCGYPEQGKQICLDSCKIGKSEPIQVRIS